MIRKKNHNSKNDIANGQLNTSPNKDRAIEVLDQYTKGVPALNFNLVNH